MTLKMENISAKLSRGVNFGLYDNGCYFDDGTKVNYHDLWAAIRVANNLDAGHQKTLFDLYPNNFRGSFSHKFTRYRQTKKLLCMIFGVV